MQLDYLDLFFCHRPDPNTPIEETVRAMDDLIHQGLILYWGTSEWSASDIMRAHGIAREHHLSSPQMEQPQYNMLHRKFMERDYIPLFETFGMGTTIWSPLASGLLTGKYLDDKQDEKTRMDMMQWLKDRALGDKANVEKVKKLNSLAKEIGISLTHLALCWCLKNKNVSTVILGASKVSQLEENLKCTDSLPKLTDEVMTKIEEILQNKPQIVAY